MYLCIFANDRFSMVFFCLLVLTCKKAHLRWTKTWLFSLWFQILHKEHIKCWRPSIISFKTSDFPKKFHSPLLPSPVISYNVLNTSNSKEHSWPTTQLRWFHQFFGLEKSHINVVHHKKRSDCTPNQAFDPFNLYLRTNAFES